MALLFVTGPVLDASKYAFAQGYAAKVVPTDKEPCLEDHDGLLPDGCSVGGGGGGGGGEANNRLRSFVIASSVLACSGHPVTFSASVHGGEGSYSYEWYEGYDGVSYSFGHGTNYGPTYSVRMPPGLDLYIKLKVSSGYQTVFSFRHVENIDDSPYCAGSYKSGAGETIRADEGQLTPSFVYSEAYPNPFNPSTVIAYDLPKSADVDLAVYDLTGREVARLVNGRREAGYYRVVFDASRLPSGIYLYRLQAGSFVVSKQMTLLK